MTLGHIDPDYHESACHYHIVRAKFTKIHDFVPFDICQDPVRQLLTFFQKFLKNWISKIFWCPQTLGKNEKKKFFDETQNFKSL